MVAMDFMGRALMGAGSQAEADSTWAHMAHIAGIRRSVDTTNVYANFMLATAYASLGELSLSIEVLESIPEVQKEDYYAYLTGRIYERNNERSKALSYIERAFTDYYNVLIIESDAMLESLRTSPAYRELLETFNSSL